MSKRSLVNGCIMTIGLGINAIDRFKNMKLTALELSSLERWDADSQIY